MRYPKFVEKIGWLVAWAVFSSVLAPAQLSIQFHFEKETFARREPVFLYLTLVNKRPDEAVVDGFGLDDPSCYSVFIRVSSDPAPNSPCARSRSTGCIYNGPIRTTRLSAGQSYTTRFLLNFDHEIDTPGEYSVDAKYYSGSNRADVGHAELEFRIGAASAAVGHWNSWTDQLQSPLAEQRRDAARTLASVAPPELEETLLGFAQNPEFRQYAPLAIHRLNSNRSAEALAQLVRGPAFNEQLEAVRYLGESGDQRWYPLLREMAEKNAQISNYPASAAELGGDKIVPLLVVLGKDSESKGIRRNAIIAMGSTGSRTAIPILLDLLQSPDVETSGSATDSLQMLTHRTAISDPRSRDRQDEYNKWSRWWTREGLGARIYRAGECGEMVVLP